MKLKKWLPAAIVAIAGLGLVLSQVKPAELLEALRGISPLWAAAGLCLALVSYSLKSLRFGLFLKPDISPVKLFGVTIAQNVIAQLFPARAGDVGYVIILRRMKLAGAGHGLMSLFASRIMDVLVLCSMYIWAVWRLDFEVTIFRRFAEIFAVMAFAVLLAALLAVLNRRRAARVMERISARLKIGWLDRLVAEFNAVLAGGGRIRPFKHVVAPLFLSAAIWSVSACWIYLLWRSVGARLEMAQVVFLMSFSLMLGLIPVFIFGGVGALDGINTLALVSFGLASSDAAAFSLCNRAVSLVYLIILTLIALILTRGGIDAEQSRGKRDGDDASERI